MTVRPYNSDDYPMIESWWKRHGWSPVPEHFLPTVGIIIELDGTPKCATWVMQENSTPIAMMEWTVTNPDNRPKESVAAIREAVASVKVCAKAIGRTALMTYCKQPSLARIYAGEGFQLSDTGMTHLVMHL